jgi:hypothetical protein
MVGYDSVMRVTVVADDTNTIDAEIVDGHVLVTPEQLPIALGWTLKPEGLCRDAVCVPVRNRAALFHDDRLDLAAVTHALDRPSVVDTDAGLVAVGRSGEQRHEALQSLVAPDFELPDLDGTPHRLSEWRGRKRLLHAFASW